MLHFIVYGAENSRGWEQRAHIFYGVKHIMRLLLLWNVSLDVLIFNVQIIIIHENEPFSNSRRLC